MALSVSSVRAAWIMCYNNPERRLLQIDRPLQCSDSRLFGYTIDTCWLSLLLVNRHPGHCLRVTRSLWLS